MSRFVNNPTVHEMLRRQIENGNITNERNLRQFIRTVVTSNEDDVNQLAVQFQPMIDALPPANENPIRRPWSPDPDIPQSQMEPETFVKERVQKRKRGGKRRSCKRSSFGKRSNKRRSRRSRRVKKMK